MSLNPIHPKSYSISPIYLLVLLLIGCIGHSDDKDKTMDTSPVKEEQRKKLNLDRPEYINQVQVGEYTISYRILGEKSQIPILLLQRYRGSMVDWDPLFLRGLTAHNQVIIFDNSGIGASSGTVAISIDEMATTAIDFLKSLKYTKVHLLGWSMGGFVAQKMMDIEPQLFEKMILMATTYEGSLNTELPPDSVVLSAAGGESWGFRENKLLLFTDSEQGHNAALASWKRIDSITQKLGIKPVETEAYNAQGVAIEQFLTAQKPTLSHKLQASKVLVMDGDSDSSYDLRHQANLAKKYASNLAIYPNAGHGFHQQYPVRMAGDIIQFLNGNL